MKEKREITISTHNGSKVSTAHNLRIENAIKNQDHIDRNGEFEVWKYEDIKDSYERIFGPYVKEYNDTHYPYEHIKDYYAKVEKNSKLHTCYEMIIGIGNINNGEKGNLPANICKEIMKEFIDTWDKRNPSMELFSCVYHNDEEGVGHVHCSYYPKGKFDKNMKLRASLTRALNDMGFKTVNQGNTAQMQWQKAQNEYLQELCERRNEFDVTVIHPGTAEHYNVKIYKAKQELEQTLDNNKFFEEENKKLEDKNHQLNKQNEILKKGLKKKTEFIVNNNKHISNIKEKQKEREDNLDIREQAIIQKENDINKKIDEGIHNAAKFYQKKIEIINNEHEERVRCLEDEIANVKQESKYKVTELKNIFIEFLQEYNIHDMWNEFLKKKEKKKNKTKIKTYDYDEQQRDDDDDYYTRQL